MSDHERDTDQLMRLVEADRPEPRMPDVDGLLAAGHRRLRRRRYGAGAAALAAAAAIAVPAYVVSGGPGERASDNPPVATQPPNEPRGKDGCGVLLCVDPKETVSEGGELVGEPWVLSEPADGVEEVVYTVRKKGVDLATGEPGMVDVLMLGYRQDGKLHRMAATVQPGSEAVSPGGDMVSMWSNGGRLGERDSDEFFVVGYVEGAPDEITWSTPDGEEGAVDGMDTSVVPGHTVFYLTMPNPEGSEGAGSAGEYKVVEPDDGKAVELHGNGTDSSFPPDLTFHSSDGWSCSLADCGSVG